MSNTPSDIQLGPKAWPLRGKSLHFGDMMFGLAGPVKNLVVENVMPFNMVALMQSRFEVISAIDARKPEHRVVNPGDFSYLPRGMWQSSESEESGDYLYFFFGDRLCHQFQEEVDDATVLLDPVDRHPKLERSAHYSALLFDFLSTEGLGGPMKAEALAMLLMFEVMNFRGKVYEPPKVGLGKKKVELVTQYIDAHPDEELSLSMLAELTGVSVFHFSRMFKNDVGMTPHKFVMHRRLEKAKGLLRDSDLAIAEIAYLLGFSSQSHLTESFRRSFGTTPGKFRRVVNS